MLVIGDSTSTPDYGENVSSHTHVRAIFFRIVPTRSSTEMNVSFIPMIGRLERLAVSDRRRPTVTSNAVVLHPLIN